MALNISSRVVDGVTVVDVEGRIVLGEEASSLRDAVKDLLKLTKKIVLNLKGVGYIDSGGLGVLVSIHTSSHNQQASVKLTHLTPKVDTLLQVTKLLTVFDVYATEEEALKSFA